jgi:transposase
MLPNERCAVSPSGAAHGLFAGSDRGGERAAAMYTPIATAKLNDINPQA